NNLSMALKLYLLRVNNY
ncbi:hypothetical protein FOXB_16039, partial [Fusarium oxysporum f. sp. conglutinans Fo5176]